MPANYSILPHFNLVVVRYGGVLTAEESMTVFLAYMTSRDALLGRPVLVDCNQMEAFDAQGASANSFVQQKLALLDPRIPQVHAAFYAPQPHQFAIAEGFATLLSGASRMRVSTHLCAAEALAALNVAQVALSDPSVLARS